MTADEAQRQSPAPTLIGVGFHNHLLKHLSACPLAFNDLLRSKYGDTMSNLLRMGAMAMQVGTMQRLAATKTAASLMPSMNEVSLRSYMYSYIETNRQVTSPADLVDKVRDTWDVVLEEDRQALRFDRELATSFTARRITRTRDNLIGIGPRSTQVDDKAFVLPGANVPFVLRRRSDGTYRWIGEAYVHGIMHGEALDRDDLELERLDML